MSTRSMEGVRPTASAYDAPAALSRPPTVLAYSSEK
jgi:hypothetical protein